MTMSLPEAFLVVAAALTSGILLGLPLNLVLHEFGHVAGGLIDGYRLVAVRLGPLLLLAPGASPDDGSDEHTHGGDGWHCLFTHGMGSFTVMVPSAGMGKRVPDRYREFVLGGIVGNSLMVVASGLILVHCTIVVGVPPTPSFSVWHLVGVTMISVAKWCDNAIPRRHSGVGNDAWIAVLLRGSERERRDFRRYLTVYATVCFGWRDGGEGADGNDSSDSDGLIAPDVVTPEQAVGYYASAIMELMPEARKRG